VAYGVTRWANSTAQLPDALVHRSAACLLVAEQEAQHLLH